MKYLLVIDIQHSNILFRFHEFLLIFELVVIFLIRQINVGAMRLGSNFDIQWRTLYSI